MSMDFDELKKQRGGIIGVRDMSHISGMNVPMGTKCSLIMSVDDIYIDAAGASIKLPMNYAKNIMLIDYAGLEKALAEDPGNPFYHFLAYGPPGFMADEGFKKPKFLNRLSPYVLAIEQGDFYQSSPARIVEDTRERDRLLNASYGANTTHGGDIRTNRAYYNNRSRKNDYYCFKVKRTSIPVLRNGLIEQFELIKRNRNVTFSRTNR